jgi:hypothetical protein
MASVTKRFTLKGAQISIVQGVERWIVFVELATYQHLEFYCKAFLKHPVLLLEATLNRKYPK